MNFLAHLHLADRAGLPLAGAILGDLVRGPLENRFPEPLSKSLRLHRRIDAVTDAHPVVQAARREFAPGARRYAGIILDVVWDHCLALNWSDPEPLPAFAARAAAAMADPEAWQATGHSAPDASRFAALLLSYRAPAGVDVALERIAQRSGRPERLLGAAQDWCQRLPGLSAGFPILYTDLLRLAETR